MITAAVSSWILCCVSLVSQTGCRGCVCVCVWVRDVVLDLQILEVADSPPHTHVQTQLTNVPVCWISPHLMISIWSRFLQTQTNTHTQKYTQIALTQPLNFLDLLFGLKDCSLLSVSGIGKGKLTHHHRNNSCTLNRAVLYSFIQGSGAKWEEEEAWAMWLKWVVLGFGPWETDTAGFIY